MRLKKLCMAILTIALFGFYGSTAISDPTRPNGPTAAGVFGETARMRKPMRSPGHAVLSAL